MKEKQLNTLDANNSRIVTKVRHVIERSFGRLKQKWKILMNIISNNLIPKIHSIFRILCAFENAFSKNLNYDNEFDTKIIEIIIKKRNLENPFLELLKKKIVWKKINFEKIKELFPKYDKEKIIQFSLGIYGEKLSKRYINHTTELFYYQHPKRKNIFKIRGLLSRFELPKKGNKKYKIYFQIEKNYEPSEIISYCSCKSCSRTISGCSHSTAILRLITHGIKLKKKKKYDIIDLSKKIKK